MSGRGGSKRRGRPPKTPSMERSGSGSQPTGKFQYHLLKKPKYLLNRGSDSQLSTPTASRASSPHGSTDSSRPSMPRPSTSRMSVTGGSARKGRAAAASASVAVTPASSGKRGKAAQSATPYSKKGEWLDGYIHFSLLTVVCALRSSKPTNLRISVRLRFRRIFRRGRRRR